MTTPRQIETLLHRRTDLSTFLVHLTRGAGGRSARENLLEIASGGLLEARSPFGPAKGLEPALDAGSTQNTVCFTETPLEHAWMMVEEIEGRAVKMSPYGLVFTKMFGRLNHLNPVWYTNTAPTTGIDWSMKAIDRMVSQATSDLAQGVTVSVDSHPVLAIAPYIEQMGQGKEFWWEREWRHIGHLNFWPTDAVALLAPEADHNSLKADLNDACGGNGIWANRPVVDPRWGLERMIMELAGVREAHKRPFPPKA